MPKVKTTLITTPNPHLRQKSKRIGIVTDDIRQIIEAMKTATLDWENSRKHEVGVALAAIQIDQPHKIIIVRDDFEDKENKTFSVFINPDIIKYEGEVKEDFEGCLSVPDIYGKVPRHSKIRVRAQDENGQPIHFKAEGFLARVFQHELDHINGVVFVDHLKGNKDAFFKLTEEGKLEAMPLSAVKKLHVYDS